MNWRALTDFPDYEVSDDGQVRSWKPLRNFAPRPTEPRLLKSKIDKDGYVIFTLYVEGNRRDIGAHILVALAFVGPKPVDQEVRHLDGSKNRNVPDNLCWGTRKENAEDRAVHGTQVRGEEINTAVLSEADVAVIKSSRGGLRAIGEKFGVSPSAVWQIREGRTWKHVI
jgi:hypothetical protein